MRPSASFTRSDVHYFGEGEKLDNVIKPLITF
jgi:hypothetical protein